MAVRRNRHRLLDREQISSESIGKELFKAAADGVQFARFIDLLDLFRISALILPEWTALEGFTHDPIHHPEGGSTVQGHILECLIQGNFDNPVTNLSILFHDLGKATTRGIKENGHSNYHGHEGAGVPIVQGIFDRIRFNDLSAEDKDAILFATEKHMLIHNIGDLNIRTVARLVHNPGWENLIRVAFADEASRGEDMFNDGEFGSRIAGAEARVNAIAANRDELRLRVKQYIDGDKLLAWFPELADNRKLMSPMLADIAQFILECLDLAEEPSQEDIRAVAEDTLCNLLRPQ